MYSLTSYLSPLTTYLLPLILRREVFFSYAAEGAYPVLWKIFKSGSWLNAVVRVAYGGVVYIPTSLTYVLHNLFGFRVNKKIIVSSVEHFFHLINNHLWCDTVHACHVAAIASLVAKNAARPAG